MRVAIDCDGVLCRFDEGFNEIADRLFPGRGVKEYVPTSWENLGGLTRDEQGIVWKEIGATPNFWRNLPTYADSMTALNTFIQESNCAHDIYIVTSRRTSAGDSLTTQTSDWLRSRILGAVPQVIVVERKEHKRDLYQLLRIDASIDDNFDTFTACYSLPRHQTWLLNRPWNAGEAWGRRVTTLAEFFAKVVGGLAEGGVA